ncbi:MAG: hypothetical protein Q7I97_07745 [Thermovirgaceae bacterium]|nr:hypothetical protein [Thermovirgaceae bacterium]
MCRVITPDSVGGHSRVDDPLSIAELLRETLSEELNAMTELAARHHMIDDEDVCHALGHLIDARRQAISAIWDLLQKTEDKTFGKSDQGHKH